MFGATIGVIYYTLQNYDKKERSDEIKSCLLKILKDNLVLNEKQKTTFT